MCTVQASLGDQGAGGLGFGRVDELGRIQAGQRAHAIPSVIGSQRLDEGELHIGPVLDLLAFAHVVFEPAVRISDVDAVVGVNVIDCRSRRVIDSDRLRLTAAASG